MGNKSSSRSKFKSKQITTKMTVKPMHVSFKNKPNPIESMDLTIFEPTDFDISCNKESGNVISCCSALQRISVGLRYYELLFGDDIDANTENQEIFVHFNTEVYKKK
eukprot:196497_1